MQGAVETEIKIRISGLPPVLDRIREIGFQPAADRQFEANTLYDNAANDVRNARHLLRLRESGGKFVITFKGPGRSGPHKSREEIETTVGSLDAMQQIFERLGYAPVFRYEKYRTEYRRPGEGPGVITVDETPIGLFLELEGPGDWIDQTAADLGFSRQDYVLDSYGKLYLTDCQRRGVEPAHMVFAS